MAHRFAGGRWLATGGGGYDAYRVVPRMWSLVWLAGAHRTSRNGRPRRGASDGPTEAGRYRQSPLPETFLDPPNAGVPVDDSQDQAEAMSLEMVDLVRRVVVPRFLREARGSRLVGSVGRQRWGRTGGSADRPPPRRSRHGRPRCGCDGLVGPVAGGSRSSRRSTRPTAHAIVAAALAQGASVVAAVAGIVVVGLAVTGPDDALLALGVAPDHRRAGLATALLRASHARSAEVTVAERDPVDPLPHAVRAQIARRVLEQAGFTVSSAPTDVRRVDPLAIAATRD